MKIEHRIGVKAPAEVVWEILFDVAGWPAWNPLYPEAAGAVRFGEKLKLTLALPDQNPRVIEPVILDWAPNEAIHWQWSSPYGLVRTIRYLEIEVMSPTGCIFSNGEIYQGLLGASTARRTRETLKSGFTALGEAMRDRAEALWRKRSGKTKKAK